jgi:hypothetical protein
MDAQLKIDTSDWDKVICTDSPLSLFKPNHIVTFFNKELKEVGKLDFNEDKLKFEGDVEESTQVFIDFLLNAFNQRIEEIKEAAYDKGYYHQHNLEQ